MNIFYTVQNCFNKLLKALLTVKYIGLQLSC
jgi:hypothetical protein